MCVFLWKLRGLNIDENATALFTNVNTLNDFKLLWISWIFDLNFTEPFWQLKKNSFIEAIFSDLPQTNDDFYGFSLGSGFSNKNISIDAAYEFRTGNDVGESMMPGLGFSQDVEQHTLYMSIIVYLQ